MEEDKEVDGSRGGGFWSECGVSASRSRSMGDSSLVDDELVSIAVYLEGVKRMVDTEINIRTT